MASAYTQLYGGYLLLMNNSINFYIYVARSSEYRAAFFALIRGEKMSSHVSVVTTNTHISKSVL